MVDYLVFILSNGYQLTVTIDFSLGQAIITGAALLLAATQALKLLQKRRQNAHGLDQYDN